MTIVPFSFEGHAVRVVDRDGEPWFVAADVCVILDLSNPTVAVQPLDEDERAKLNLGPQGDTNIISESGLYTLMLRCRDAVKSGTVPHRFRRWITGEVLPTIRKTGRYHTSGPTGMPEERFTELEARISELEYSLRKICRDLAMADVCIYELNHAMIEANWHRHHAYLRADYAEQCAAAAEHALTAVLAGRKSADREARCRAAWPKLRGELSDREYRALRARSVCELTGCSMAVATQMLCDLVHAGVIERDNSGGRTFRLTGRDLP